MSVYGLDCSGGVIAQQQNERVPDTTFFNEAMDQEETSN